MRADRVGTLADSLHKKVANIELTQVLLFGRCLRW